MAKEKRVYVATSPSFSQGDRMFRSYEQLSSFMKKPSSASWGSYRIVDADRFLSLVKMASSGMCPLRDPVSFAMNRYTEEGGKAYRV